MSLSGLQEICCSCHGEHLNGFSYIDQSKPYAKKDVKQLIFQKINGYIVFF